MTKVELWGLHPGGRSGRVSSKLAEAIQTLIREHGAEAVAQVAVRESQVMPTDEKL